MSSVSKLNSNSSIYKKLRASENVPPKETSWVTKFFCCFSKPTEEAESLIPKTNATFSSEISPPPAEAKSDECKEGKVAFYESTKHKERSSTSQFTQLVVPYKDTSGFIPAATQAKDILNAALEYKGEPKIGLTYAANTTQSMLIRRNSGLAKDSGIGGANQANVVASMIKLLKMDKKYSPLANRFYIIPFSSMIDGGGNIEYSSLENPVTRENIKEVDYLATFSKQVDAHVIVWGNSDGCFPIGGGVSRNFHEPKNYGSKYTSLYTHLCCMIRKQCPQFPFD